MCLACHRKIGVHGKEAIEKVFDFPDWATDLTKAGYGVSGNILHTHDNKEINLTYDQVREIIDNALVVVVTGVDTRVDVWAVQWPKDYSVVNF